MLISDKLMLVLASLKHYALTTMDKPAVKLEVAYTEKLDTLVKQHLSKYLLT